jgi:integrase
MPPRKRRQYGTGSVYQRSSDGRWIGKIQAGWSTNGTRRTLTVSASTEAEAKRRLRDKQREIAEAGMPAEGTRRRTVKAWSEQWLPMHARTVRPKAYASTASAVRRWVVPTIGHKDVERLTPADVRAVRTAVERAGLSLSTAHAAHTALITMLKAARQEGYRVPVNVTEVKGPGRAASDREAIPTDGAVAMLEVAAERHDGSRWVAALLQGIRQGERLGLTWDAVDFDAELIDISWQLQPLPYLDPKDKALGYRVPDGYEARHLTHAYHLVRPKTTAGQRIIPMVPWLASSLASWAQVAPANPWGLVWSDVDRRYGRERPAPIRSAADLAAWKDLQAAAGVAHPTGRFYTDHEARNTTATLLFEADVDPKVITAILGHSSIVTSRGYQTVRREGMRDAMERVAKRLGRG